MACAVGSSPALLPVAVQCLEAPKEHQPERPLRPGVQAFLG